MSNVYLGIDFGTSNCSVAYVYDDPRLADSKLIPVDVMQFETGDVLNDRAERIPTILGADTASRSGKRTSLIGWHWVRKFLGQKNAPALRHGQNFFRSVKSDLGTLRVYPHAFDPACNTPEKVVAAILRSLIDEARRSISGFNPRTTHVMVTVPASLCAAAREQMIESCIAAGINGERMELIDEPVAALIDLLNDSKTSSILDDEEPRNVAVFDYGGGTLDISLVRAKFESAARSGLYIENLAISPYRRLGGDIIDGAILDEVVIPQVIATVGEDAWTQMSIVHRSAVEDTLRLMVARPMKERMSTFVKSEKLRGQSYEQIRRSKPIEVPLGSVNVDGLKIGLPRRFRIDFRQFYDIMNRFLAPPDTAEGLEDAENWILHPLFETMLKGGVDPSELDVLVMHGGSCKNPLLSDVIQSTFEMENCLFGDCSIVQTPDLDASVARGAAIACYWKHARKHQLVAPIIPEELGVITLSDQPVRLLAAGARLPFPGMDEVHLVPTEFSVPNDDQRELLVPFYSGVEHRLTGVVKVPLPAGTPRGASVRIRLKVDSRKLLKWWYQVNGGEILEAMAINDPWTAEPPSQDARYLNDVRMRMREAIQNGKPVSPADELEEAVRLRFLGRYDEATRVLEGLGEPADIDTRALVLNQRAVLASAQDRHAEAVAWGIRAIQAAPRNAIMLGNLGAYFVDLGNDEAAEAHLRASVSLDCDNAYIFECLAGICRRRGDESGAMKELAQARRSAELRVSRAARDWRGWLELARIARASGDYSRAQEAEAELARLRNIHRFDGDPDARIAGPDSGVSDLRI